MTQLKSLLLNSRFILILIFINSILIFIQEFNGVPRFLYHIDNGFIVIFMIEICVKIRTYTFKEYWKRPWNKFDFIIVSLSFVSMIVEMIFNGSTYSFTFLTSFRVLRTFKLFRLFKFIPNIKSIINGVNLALKTSYVVILSFLILLFIVSIFTCSMYKNIAPEYFETPLSSVYSIFRIFSIEGWYEIPDLIATRTTPFFAFMTKLYFVSILFIGGMLGMSLINSIFVDAMVSDNNDSLEDKVKDLSDKIEELTNEIKSLKK